LDLDDLEVWLTLAEMQIKHGDTQGERETYAGYEQRRKGLIDGLTLSKEDAYVLDPAGRARCALALLPATDIGTANALIYSLKTDPAPLKQCTMMEYMSVSQPLTKMELQNVQLRLAEWCFVHAMPFSVMDNLLRVAICDIRQGFKPPNRNALANHWLDIIHDKYCTTVTQVCE
jgi:hypothetical protein